MDENNYGFVFNDITIKNNIFIKKSKNELGRMKINNEIDFYLYIIKNNIYFSMPKLLKYQDGNLSIEYISDSSTLTYKINSFNIKEYIIKIKTHLYPIHNINKIVSFYVVENDLQIEVKKKLLDRFDQYKWSDNITYNSINSVNNIKIKNVEYYSDVIYNKLVELLKGRNYYNLIHGDTHLGNILVDKNDKIYFIDPRGYFGETKLFGLFEYDYAKLLFGLSGYSIFDTMTIDKINVVDNNIEIDFIKNHEFIFETGNFDKITILLSLSIWLGNNSCFSNINKKITSLMIAYYYCEKYLDIY